MEQKTGKYLKRALVILAVLAGIFSARPAGAADRLVPAQYATIQAAITAAANYDTIIVAPGTYNENISFNGKNLTLRSADPDDPNIVVATIIQGTGTTSVVKFTNKENSSCLLDGFTITGGAVSGSGGGIVGNNTDTCPTISRCVITGNSATSAGGGIWGCKGRISRCVIAGNTSVYGGGIAACNGLILNCLICNNQADYGGGIHNCDGSILNCTITQNTGTTGVLNSCDGKLANCIIWGNSPDALTNNTSVLTYSCWPEGTSGTGNISIDPNFVSSSDFHLAAGSGCIDTGLNTTASLTVYEDLQGNFRPQDGDRNGSEIADMGTYEYPGFARLMMTEPEGGELWAAGSTHRLAWESRNYEGTIDLSYSLNGGTDWLAVVGDIANSGNYQWTVPDANSDQCLVAIAAHEEPAGIVYGQQEAPFTIHPDAVGAAVSALWKTQGHDVQRSGLADFAGPEVGCIQWQYHTPEAVTTGLVVGADNNLHIVCEDGILYTVNADGEEVWQFDSGSELIETPSVGPDGSVYFGAKNGKLYALDKQGQLRWTHNTGGIVYCSPAVGADGKVFFGCQDGTLYALGADGSELWRFRVPTASRTAVAMQVSPTIGQDGTIYIGSLFQPILYALNPSDGSIVWQTPSLGGAGICTSPVVAYNGTIYLNTKDDTHLLALDPADGTVLWSIDLRDPAIGPFDPADPDTFSAWNPPALGPDGTIYVSFDDSYLRAVNPNGSLKWITRLGMGEGFSLTVDAAGRIYAAGEDSSIYVLEPQEGRVASVLNGIFYNIPSLFSGMEITGTDDCRYAGQTNSVITAYDPNNIVKWSINLNSVYDYNISQCILTSLGMINPGILYALGESPSNTTNPSKCICIIDTETGQIIDTIVREVGPGYINNNTASFVAQKTPMSYPVIAGNGLLYFTDFHRTVSAVAADACGESPLSLHHPCDLDGNQAVDFVDYALFLNTWWMCTDYDNTQICQYRSTWRNRPWAYFLHFNEALIYQPGDFDRDYYVTLEDLLELADNWLTSDMGMEPGEIIWIYVDDPGIPDQEGFTGQMSKYEITNGQYCRFLNEALGTGDLSVDGTQVIGAGGSHSGEDYAGQLYYDLAGAGLNDNGAIDGGAARIQYNEGIFSVDADWGNHPVTHVSWYGAAAFCNYYGYCLPTEWQWQAAADYDGSYIYGCGVSINHNKANYYDSLHPQGTTVAGRFGCYGYGMGDLAGNVQEWTATMENDSNRVIRGGGWNSDESHCMVSYRYDTDRGYTNATVGFRVCRAGALVPYIIGMPQAAAEDAILAASLQVGTITQQYHATIPAGVVIRSEPGPGSFVLSGSAVNLVISLGVREPDGMVWIPINDPGVSGHESFSGQMSQFEITNAQYCDFLNAALATQDVSVYSSTVAGANGANGGADYAGLAYYNLSGAGETYNGATKGGAARINYNGRFSVDSGFENHPVTYVSWYGAMAFCNYYGYYLPSEWQWRAVADHDGSFVYGCGTGITTSLANYYNSTHPYGTTVVGSFGPFGYEMCDMAGNIWEWTSSAYSSTSYILCGGGWSSNDSGCAISAWANYSPSGTSYYYGFRPCR